MRIMDVFFPWSLGAGFGWAFDCASDGTLGTGFTGVLD